MSEHMTRWPSPAATLGLPAAPSSASSSGKSSYRILTCHFTGMLPQILGKGDLPALQDQPFKPQPCLKSISISLFDCGLKKEYHNNPNPQFNLSGYSVTGGRRITVLQHLNQEKNLCQRCLFSTLKSSKAAFSLSSWQEPSAVTHCPQSHGLHSPPDNWAIYQHSLDKGVYTLPGKVEIADFKHSRKLCLTHSSS